MIASQTQVDALVRCTSLVVMDIAFAIVAMADDAGEEAMQHNRVQRARAHAYTEVVVIATRSAVADHHFVAGDAQKQHVEIVRWCAGRLGHLYENATTPPSADDIATRNADMEALVELANGLLTAVKA